MHTFQVYLASQSPRRVELLQQIGVSFSKVPGAVDETPFKDEPPSDYVRRMALEKARAGWLASPKDRPVIGADTAGVLDGEILCKPVDRKDGIAMLGRMSGRSHQILSAVCVVFGDHELVAISTSEVTFAELDSSLIEAYWDTGEASDKAGAYGIQGMAAMFIEHMSGSYSGIVGLPLRETYQLLKKMDALISGKQGEGETTV